MNYKTQTILGFEILNSSYAKFRESVNKGAVLTISPNSFGISTKNENFRNALQSSEILVLDGVYFALNYFLRTGKTIVKNQGPDIFYEELKIQNKLFGKVFFLGASKNTLEKIRIRLNKEYPNINSLFHSPPFKEKLSKNDNTKIYSMIDKFKPSVVFVGMTCPKQEIWIHENKNKYPNTLFLAIGGVFDWYAGNYKELNPIWWKLRLGWLGRSIQRPDLLRRNIPNIWIYFKNILKK